MRAISRNAHGLAFAEHDRIAQGHYREELSPTPAPDDQPFTVLLLYPETLAENYGSETYLAQVVAVTPAKAVFEAQREANRVNRVNQDRCGLYGGLSATPHRSRPPSGRETVSSAPSIDLSADMASLQSLRGADHHAALAKLIEKHGGGCNEYGVFLDPEIVRIAEAGKAGAEVKLARTPDGLWFTGYNYCYSTGEGGGGPASVTDHRAYRTREDALCAMSDWFADRFRIMQENAYGENAKASAQQMLAIIESLKYRDQLDLFASA